MQITEELYRVVDALAKHDIDYAVCGGLAVAIHGRPRLTVDIDILVAATDIPKAAEILAAVGFDDVAGWVPLPPSSLGIHRLYRINKFAGSEYLTLDLLEADSASNAILVDRETFDIEGRAVQSLSKNALIKMKLDSNRTKDRLDVELLSDQAD